MNLCNVCKKYFNEPHDCTTTREEKLPIVLYVEKGSFTFNCVESAEKLHGWGSPEKYILNKEHESLLREARAKIEKLEKINDMNLLLIREYQEVIHDELDVYGDNKKMSPHDARLIFSQRRMLQGKSGINKATKARKE